MRQIRIVSAEEEGARAAGCFLLILQLGFMAGLGVAARELADREMIGIASRTATWTGAAVGFIVLFCFSRFFRSYVLQMILGLIGLALVAGAIMLIISFFDDGESKDASEVPDVSAVLDFGEEPASHLDGDVVALWRAEGPPPVWAGSPGDGTPDWRRHPAIVEVEASGTRRFWFKVGDDIGFVTSSDMNQQSATSTRPPQQILESLESNAWKELSEAMATDEAGN